MLPEPHYFILVMNGPNKLVCFSLASLSSLVLYNTLAYWTHYYLTNIKHRECDTQGSIHNTPFS